jgi:hypothetical protein
LPPWLLAMVAAAGSLGGCSDAGLYAIGGGGPGGPDRLELAGRVCAPLAGGEAFPVKVVFALQGGVGMDSNALGEVVDGLNEVVAQFSTPYISFAVIAHHTIATGLQGSFVNDSRVASAFGRYSSYQESGPISHRAPLKLAESIIGGDMQTGCRGVVARTRYLVVLLMATADASCGNPVFNPGIATKCNAFLPDDAQCSACELSRVTEELRGLANRYGGGEVVVQPIYMPTSPPPPGVADVTAFQAAAIARAGGTELITAPLGNVKDTLTSLNYASLQRALKLKQLIAMNRNAIARQSQLLVDSDGDGLSDDEETSRVGTNPTLGDTDGDGLWDGVELKMGLKPQPVSSGGVLETISACNVASDLDGDRLNDCEERVLGTDACISDTDGDGLPDLVEYLGGTNPLIAEDLSDDDRDGLTNVGEVATHSDPLSDDIAFQRERGVGYAIKDAPPTPDGRACYDVSIYNIGLVGTLERPSPDGTALSIPKGTNDVYVYFQVGRENDPRGTGIGSLFVPQVRYVPPGRNTPAIRRPKGVIQFTPDDFVSGY